MAFWEYTKRKSGEISLRKGCVVDVLEKHLSGLPWKCKAIRDYSGRSKEDVTYRHGDIVEVISANLDGWWQVRCQGKTGFTPGAYLQRVNTSPCHSGESDDNPGINHQRSIYLKGSPPPKHNVEMSCDTEKQYEVNYTQVYFDDTNTKSEGDMTVKRIDSGVKYTEVVDTEEDAAEKRQTEEKTTEAKDLPRVRAICDYQGHRKTVLSFNKDDEAKLISKSPTGWWCVNLRGRCGWVPGNYWQVIETKPPVPTRLSPVKDMNKKRSTPLSNYTAEPWFVGKMSRSESEALLETGSDLNFIVGDFTLSVLDEGHVRHFPIEVTADHKYFVGEYHFSDLRKVVLYYSKQPLFYSQHKRSAVSLGEPRRLHPTSEQPS
ncbi:hypothetical protein NP493_578g00001 [Ridgeia piscesae]|uniref:Uncharacterized protein n=1 Tax=Ridgeia piscesae TaxID=27915 RepID=A0AAD9KVZ6_RIDPI|nr:hypothetical protein NP493_578g00001 [Ridgeia piscesae]